MSNLEKDLEEYLNREYPLFQTDEYYKMIYSDIAYGKESYKQEILRRRQDVTPIFIAGYLAAFKEGNLSPNSYHVVISQAELLKLGGRGIV